MLNFYDTQGMIREIRDRMGGWRQEIDMGMRDEVGRRENCCRAYTRTIEKVEEFGNELRILTWILEMFFSDLECCTDENIETKRLHFEE